MPSPQAPHQVEIGLDALTESDLNARVRFERLDELAATFRSVGIIEPLIVRPVGGQRFEIVVGHRRFRAAKLAGLRSVPAIVRILSDAEVMEYQVIENWQREDVHELDLAETFARWMELNPSITVQDIAARIGKKEKHVYTLLQFPKHLAAATREAFRNREIGYGHAQALLPHPVDVQERAVEAIRTQHLKVKELREWLKRHESQPVEQLLPFTPEAEPSLTDARRRTLARERTVTQVHECLAAGAADINREVLELLAAVIEAMPGVPTDVPEEIQTLTNQALATRIVMRLASLDSYRYVHGQVSLMQAVALACGISVAEIEAAQFQTLETVAAQ